MANDLLGALRTYLSKVSAGEKSPQEVAAALNQWAKESGEAIKVRIEEEVERKVSRMGFAKQSDLVRLEREVAELKRGATLNTSAKKSAAKSGNKAPKVAKVAKVAKKAAKSSDAKSGAVKKKAASQ